MADMTDGLISTLLDDRVRGLNYFEIQAKHGIPAAEAKQLVNEALQEVATKDPLEMRYVVQLRLEKITQHLWEGLENGGALSHKHAEVILKAADQLAVLMDLNQQTIKQQLTIISDEETAQLLEVLRHYSRGLYGRINALPLNKKARQELEQWAEWTADAATEAVEEVIYAEVEE
jgi:hypothetical protein